MNDWGNMLHAIKCTEVYVITVVYGWIDTYDVYIRIAKICQKLEAD